MALFLDQIPPNWADFSVWFRFFGLLRASAHNFGRIFKSLVEIFYSLVEILIENAVNI
jgi:hypothetical protein